MITHVASEFIAQHATDMELSPHITTSMALVALVGSIQITPAPEFAGTLDSSWHATLRETLDQTAKHVDYAAGETLHFLRHLKLERSPSDYNALKIGAFRRFFRYVTTLQSDPAEAWITNRDRRVVEWAQVRATDLKT